MVLWYIANIHINVHTCTLWEEREKEIFFRIDMYGSLTPKVNKKNQVSTEKEKIFFNLRKNY